MRSALWSGFLAAIVCAVTVGLVAQAPPSSSASQSAKKVTFSGCIERAPSESGSTASTSASPAFILANASPAASGSGSASGSTSPSGSVGTSGAAKAAAKYRLEADASKLSPHVGHKVEITGTVEEQSGSGSSRSGTTTSGTTTSGTTASGTTTSGTSSASAMDAPKLKVDSVKMVSSTCS
jgi:hypothetical protein